MAAGLTAPTHVPANDGDEGDDGDAGLDGWLLHAVVVATASKRTTARRTLEVMATG